MFWIWTPYRLLGCAPGRLARRILFWPDFVRPRPVTVHHPPSPSHVSPLCPVPTTALTRLTLTGFRNYTRARLEVPPQTVVLTGANGTGKTNLLEAISFLAPGRGLRGARLAEVARQRGRATDTDAVGTDAVGTDAGADVGLGAGDWAVAATLMTPDGDVEIGTGRDPAAAGGSDKRLVRIDGRAARSQTALAEHLTVVWLTPAMDRLFVEGASDRRRFLDRLVFGFDPAHAGRISRHEKAQRERMHLLREGTADATWLARLEETMATDGVAVAAARLEVVRRLQQALDTAARQSPFPIPEIAAAGPIEAELRKQPALACEETIRRLQRDNRRSDAASGSTAIGPHRSDLVVRHRGHGVSAASCSTGEQKALLVALILANARLLTAERGTAPLLLLDEVAAHLDEARRQALFVAVDGLNCQAWMTGTDQHLFTAWQGAATFLSVDNGQFQFIRA